MTCLQSNHPSEYTVVHVQGPITIDGNWNKPCWKAANTIELNHILGDKPGFHPEVKAKMMYDKKNLYVIFNVFDRFVRCKEENINGNVWEDSCVEFIFALNSVFPLGYFNLEINCTGVPLMHYNRVPEKIQKLYLNEV